MEEKDPSKLDILKQRMRILLVEKGRTGYSPEAFVMRNTLLRG
jgi:hypothetical protein